MSTKINTPSPSPSGGCPVGSRPEGDLPSSFTRLFILNSTAREPLLPLAGHLSTQRTRTPPQPRSSTIPRLQNAPSRLVPQQLPRRPSIHHYRRPSSEWSQCQTYSVPFNLTHFNSSLASFLRNSQLIDSITPTSIPTRASSRARRDAV